MGALPLSPGERLLHGNTEIGFLNLFQAIRDIAQGFSLCADKCLVLTYLVQL